MPDAWITARCAEDDLRIGWPPPGGITSVEDRRVRRFVQLRTQDPEPLADKISAIRGRTCFAFRVDDERGATWLDREEGCVFLVGMGLRRDVYEDLEYLAQRGELFPDRYDYEDLRFDRAARWLRELRDEGGPELIEAALAEPERPFVLRLSGADVTLVAYPLGSGAAVLHMLVETPFGATALAPDQAKVIAETVVERRGAEVAQIWNFLQRPVSPPNYAFDALIES